jgi:hypothetical protein
MLKYFLLFLLIWLIVRFVRGYFVIRRAARNFSRQEEPPYEQAPEPKKVQKIISKEEGEYVDFEEMDKH